MFLLNKLDQFRLDMLYFTKLWHEENKNFDDILRQFKRHMFLLNVPFWIS